MTAREKRLAIITVSVLVLGLLHVLVVRPLSAWREEALAQLPKGEKELSEIQNLVNRRAILERESEKTLAAMGNPKADLVQPKDRFEAQKKLTEMLQNMGWDKPYSISPGPLEEERNCNIIQYDVEGRCNWNRFLQTLADLEWNESVNRVDEIRISTGEGKPRVSMRVTLYLAKKDKPETPGKPETDGKGETPTPEPS